MSRGDPGEHTFYKDKRGRWVGQADMGMPNPRTGGRWRIKVVQHKDESKAELKARLDERVQELDPSGEIATVADLVKAWRKVGMPGPRSKSESTKEGLWSHTENNILPVLGDVPVNALTAAQVEAFLQARVDSHSKSTLRKLKGVLSQAYDFGVSRDHAKKNPTRLAYMPSEAEQKRYPRALSTSELSSLLNVASDHRLAAWPVVAAKLARRPGEVSGLLWDCVDLDAGTLTVRRTMTTKGVLKESTKTGKVRTFKMPDEVATALRLHKKNQAEERLLMGEKWPKKWSDLVFTSEAGTPLNPSNLRRLIDRWAEEAGIEGTVTPYDLRHTGLTRLYEKGATRDQLVDLAMHSDTRMIDTHYVHKDQVTVSAAADLWDTEAV